MKIGKIIYVRLTLLYSRRIVIRGITEKQKDICFTFFQGKLHSPEKLAQDLRAPSGSKQCYLFLHDKYPSDSFFSAVTMEQKNSFPVPGKIMYRFIIP